MFRFFKHIFSPSSTIKYRDQLALYLRTVPPTIETHLPYEKLKMSKSVICTADTKTRVIQTGKFTGRSPKDRYIVETTPRIHWNQINQSITESTFDMCFQEIKNYYGSIPKLYIFDALVGRGHLQKKIQFILEFDWQYHFVKNMFVEAPQNCTEPVDFRLWNGSSVVFDHWKINNMHSENFIILNIPQNTAIIGGTQYTGEMKKSIFSLMNYWLPQENVLPMHCAANHNLLTNETNLFFGLSGTGKTTLSVDDQVCLIGDDEHGWDDDGIFNMEGGCYAKTAGLSFHKEPTVFDAINEKALLENITLEKEIANFSDTTITENGRVSYPLSNVVSEKINGKHPSRIFFLCCDAFGIFPPVARLSRAQAIYYFLSGYTAKIGGTERGVYEPEPVFSACFGEAFMPLHPLIYAILLDEKIKKHRVQVYMINTGWTGGPYGVGKRMDLTMTRQCIQSITRYKESDLDCFFQSKDPNFGFVLPNELPLLDTKYNRQLNPIDTWKDKKIYWKQKHQLIKAFHENDRKYDFNSFMEYCGPCY